ncbi:EamA family transporter [Magnetovibrio sp. PR-2]|uniref:DMT family transporter n=1 Tax=Magnetovibrio sp. PR-2 TaxID=3120356 RepID=UPI002FCE246D
MRSLARDLSLLFILALIWSSSFTVIKVGVESVPPVTLALLRIAIGAFLLFAWLTFKGHKLPTQPQIWGSFFLIGVFGYALPFTLINWGEQQIPSGLAAIVIAAMPLAALVLGRIFSDEVLNVRRLIGVLVGFAGVIVLMGPEVLLALGDQALRQLAIAGAALCYAIGGILFRKLPTAKPLEHGTGVLIASTILLLPLAWVFEDPLAVAYTWTSVWTSIYLGLLPTAVATILLIMVIASRGVTFLALNNYLIPLMGVLWGYLFLDEQITPEILMALALIFAGIAIAGTGKATHDPA